ncbi:hypothetical protein N7520_008174 [Penicillium odoratum]|uniref:uncharacterized protein n=1 Tax=Penicillium odoratum TaxID=1167516 RepID=UPI002547AEF2|nr:uncharacterized protein N7520_008174 [Penicillium odoratum]KAJ5761018.1 hypothetical protein N7520_008174 [Penicillium odoratum]
MARWKSNIKARKASKTGTDETSKDEPTNEDQDGEAVTSRDSVSSQLDLMVPVTLRPLDQRRFWISARLEALDGRLLILEAIYTAWAER